MHVKVDKNFLAMKQGDIDSVKVPEKRSVIKLCHELQTLDNKLARNTSTRRAVNNVNDPF